MNEERDQEGQSSTDKDNHPLPSLSATYTRPPLRTIHQEFSQPKRKEAAEKKKKKKNQKGKTPEDAIRYTDQRKKLLLVSRVCGRESASPTETFFSRFIPAFASLPFPCPRPPSFCSSFLQGAKERERKAVRKRKEKRRNPKASKSQNPKSPFLNP